jgi:uncharacterized HAD superfamily protein
MLNFRSINDLNRSIVNNLHKLPHDIELIVGIPRSGLLVANIIALHLNLPLTDLDGLVEGRMINYGNRIDMDRFKERGLCNKKVLVVDDSVLSGSTMLEAIRKLSAIDSKNEIIYCTVFASPDTHSIVDIFFEEIRGDRIFEWNLMHSKIMTQSCVDIDGVLCVDPTEEENDDGERYESFLLNATPLRLPSVKIKCLVTCRLEKYRMQTESWLAAHGVEYEKLIMMDLPSKEARQASGDHASLKGNVYISTNARLFIESDNRQANGIARIANKPVLCIETQKMVYPSIVPYTTKRILRDPFTIFRRIKLFINRFNRYLLDINPPNS